MLRGSEEGRVGSEVWLQFRRVLFRSAWKIAQSPRLTKLYCAPGNPGMAELAELVDIKADDVAGIGRGSCRERGVAAVQTCALPICLEDRSVAPADKTVLRAGQPRHGGTGRTCGY